MAVRIPVDVARELQLEEGAQIECSISELGTLELVPARNTKDSKWLKTHFEAVNKRLLGTKMTSPTSALLKDEERY